jgi:hypothetical protein
MRDDANEIEYENNDVGLHLKVVLLLLALLLVYADDVVDHEYFVVTHPMNILSQVNVNIV